MSLLAVVVSEVVAVEIVWNSPGSSSSSSSGSGSGGGGVSIPLLCCLVPSRLLPSWQKRIRIRRLAKRICLWMAVVWFLPMKHRRLIDPMILSFEGKEDLGIKEFVLAHCGTFSRTTLCKEVQQTSSSSECEDICNVLYTWLWCVKKRYHSTKGYHRSWY